MSTYESDLQNRAAVEALLNSLCDDEPEQPPKAPPAAPPTVSSAAAAQWVIGDLLTVAREYLGLPNPLPALERISQDPTLRDLINTVQTNPNDLLAVQAWAQQTLTPASRAAFLDSWGIALDLTCTSRGIDRPISGRTNGAVITKNGEQKPEEQKPPQSMQPEEVTLCAPVDGLENKQETPQPAEWRPIAQDWNPPVPLEITLTAEDKEEEEEEEEEEDSRLGTVRHPRFDPEDAKQQIEISTERHKAVDKVLDLLPQKDPSLFVAGDNLVCVYKRAENEIRVTQHSALRNTRGAYGIGALEPATLTYHLARALDFFTVKANTEGEVKAKPVHPPAWLSQIVLSHAPRAEFRCLRGLTESPVLRPSGSICSKSGYDHATGYYYAPFGDPPILPANPTRQQATDAINALLKVVHQFPFKTDSDKVVWIAYLLGHSL